MSPEHVEASSATSKRSLGYLRWYPSKWRERYGEEFVAHLEVELAERPVSMARTTDIIAHGLLARLSFQPGLRNLLRAAIAAMLITGVTLGAIALTHRVAPVAITDGGSGVGEFALPSQVNDVAFNFSTRSQVAIRITSVSVVGLKGFGVPELVGAEFEAHSTDLANDSGWPIRLPKGTPLAEGGRTPLVPAIGSVVTLARNDVLWLGLRAPSLNRAYAVEMVRVTYERQGVRQTMVLNQSVTPDVICSSSSRSAVNIPAWCSKDIEVADATATFYTNWHPTKERPSQEAIAVAQFALSQMRGYGVPTLVALRYWAIQYLPASGPDGIRSITGFVNGGVPEWRFVIRVASSDAFVVRCTSRGQVSPLGGVNEAGDESLTEVSAESCHSSTPR